MSVRKTYSKYPLMLQLTGIAYDRNGSYLQGPAQAPPYFRKMDQEGSANRFSEEGFLIEAGNSYTDEGDLNINDLSAEPAYRAIKEHIAKLIQVQKPLLTLGGDHSISYPVIEAHAALHGPLHVLHFDAHTDLYEHFENNPYSHASPFARLMEKKLLASLTQVGIRTLTPHHQDQIRRYGIQVVEMRHYSENFISHLNGPLYISLDLDVLDPAYAPGVSHHEPGGLSVRQLLQALQRIQVPVIGADIVEYNPLRDLQHQTAMVGYKCMKELMALMLRNKKSG